MARVLRTETFPMKGDHSHLLVWVQVGGFTHRRLSPDPLLTCPSQQIRATREPSGRGPESRVRFPKLPATKTTVRVGVASLKNEDKPMGVVDYTF